MTTAVIYIFRCPRGRVYAGKTTRGVEAWPHRGRGPLPSGYVGSGRAWKAIFRKHGPACEWRVLWTGPEAEVWQVERRVIRLTRRVFGNRCVNFKDGGDGFTSEDVHRSWADPGYRAKNLASTRAARADPEYRAYVSAASKAAHDFRADTELAAAHNLYGSKRTPIVLPPEPVGFRPGRWAWIEVLATHFGSAPFSTAEASRLLGIKLSRVAATLRNPLVQCVTEQLSDRVWRINPRPLTNPRPCFGPKRQAQLDRVRAELGEEFTLDGWRQVTGGKASRTVLDATTSGLLERIAPGRYRFTLAQATAAEHTAALGVAAE